MSQTREQFLKATELAAERTETYVLMYLKDGVKYGCRLSFDNRDDNTETIRRVAGVLAESLGVEVMSARWSGSEGVS